MSHPKFAAAERGQAHHVETILHCDRDTMQRAQIVPAHDGILSTPGRGPGLFLQQHHEGVDLWIVRGDLAKVRVHEFHGVRFGVPGPCSPWSTGMSDSASTQTSMPARDQFPYQCRVVIRWLFFLIIAQNNQR